ncbi:MAG TPA: hypothetical protein VFY03_05480 [Woeseiaceae bacterium]|nr:hypothetical protein [Woeseiaceae bacterium]
MQASYDNPVAVVALPGAGRLTSPQLRRWLARSDVARDVPETPLYAGVLRDLGRRIPESGLGALRLWGQTGERPATWVAAADPVYLEPQRDTLCLHALPQLAPAELERLVVHLGSALGGDGFGFLRIGSLAYVTAEAPFATAAVPATALDGKRPHAYLPQGDDARGQRRLVSEIEMALHEHPVNEERAAAGEPPVNGFWLWGGGEAPPAGSERLPPLFGDDPVLRGYWLARGATCARWPGSVGRCLEDSPSGFVAVAPPGPPMDDLLDDLRRALAHGRLDRLVLRFANGLRANVSRAHLLRIWRRRHPLLEQGEP